MSSHFVPMPAYEFTMWRDQWVLRDTQHGPKKTEYDLAWVQIIDHHRNAEVWQVVLWTAKIFPHNQWNSGSPHMGLQAYGIALSKLPNNVSGQFWSASWVCFCWGCVIFISCSIGITFSSPQGLGRYWQIFEIIFGCHFPQLFWFQKFQM